MFLYKVMVCFFLAPVLPSYLVLIAHLPHPPEAVLIGPELMLGGHDWQSDVRLSQLNVMVALISRLALYRQKLFCGPDASLSTRWSSTSMQLVPGVTVGSRDIALHTDSGPLASTRDVNGTRYTLIHSFFLWPAKGIKSQGKPVSFFLQIGE
jgi:hypothetical protein